jgi:hypothetical protein
MEAERDLDYCGMGCKGLKLLSIVGPWPKHSTSADVELPTKIGIEPTTFYTAIYIRRLSNVDHFALLEC